MEIRKNNIQGINIPTSNIEYKKKSDIQYQEKDIANSPNPAEYIGRSQVKFRGKVNTKDEKNTISVKLRETPILSKEDAEKVLKKYMFPDGDISGVDLDNPKILANISYVNAYLNSGVFPQDIIEGIAKDFGEQSLEQKLDFLNEDNEKLKYGNKETFEALKDYIEIEDDGDFSHVLNFIEDCKNPDIFFEKLPLITEIESKLDGYQLTQHRYDNFDNYNLITPERIDILKQINEILPEKEKHKASGCYSLGDESELTPDLVENYTQNLKQLIDKKIISIDTLKHNYNSKDTLKSKNEKLEKVNKMFKDYPMDLESSSDKTVDFNTFYKVIENGKEQEFQEYVNSLSSDAKYKGIIKYSNKDSNIPKEQMAKLCNIVFDKDFGRICEEELFNFIEEQTKNPDINLADVISLVETYKGAGLETRQPEKYLTIANKDYAGACEAIKLKNEMKTKNCWINENDFQMVLHNPDTDFKEYNKVLNYLNNNNIRYYDYPRAIYTEPKGANKLELRHFLKERHYYHLDEEQTKVLDTIAEKIENKEEMDLVKDAFFKRDGDGYGMFEVNSINKLLDCYKDAPKFTKEVYDLKDEDNKPKFRRIDDIKNIVEAKKIDNDYTDILLNLKGRYFNGEKIKNLVEAAQIDKDYTNQLLSQVLLDETKETAQNDYILEQLKGNPADESLKKYNRNNSNNRYKAEDIKTIVLARKENPELVDYLINQKEKDAYSGYEADRFSADSINFLVEHSKTKDDKEFVKFLVDQKDNRYSEERYRFDARTIRKIIENTSLNKNFVIEAIKQTKQNYDGKEIPRYDMSEICYLSNASSIDEELTKDLMNAKRKNYYGDKKDYNRFNDVYEISTLVEKAQTDKELFNEILNLEESDYNNNINPKYDYGDLSQIMDSAKVDNKYTKYLLNINKTQNKNIYSSSDINYIAKAHAKQPEFTEKVVNLKLKQADGTYSTKFHGGDIDYLIPAYETDPDYTEEVMTYKTTDKRGNERSIYNGQNISDIANAHQTDKEFTEYLVEKSIKYGNGSSLYDGRDINYLAKEHKTNPEFTKTFSNLILKQADGSYIPKFSTHEFSTLLSANEINQEYTFQLMNYKNKDEKGNEYSIFKGSDIKAIVEANEVDEEITQSLVNQSLKIGDGTSHFSGEEIKAIVGSAQTNKELFNNNNFKEQFMNLIKDGANINELTTFISGYNFIGKTDISELTKSEKRNLVVLTLSNKNAITNNGMGHLKKHIPLMPNNEEEYTKLISDISNTLNISLEQATTEETEHFKKTITSFTETIKTVDLSNISEINLTMPQKEFISQINEILKKYPPEKQLKIEDYFGFKIKDESLLGYPSEKDLSKTNIPEIKEIGDSINKVINNYVQNNFITVKDNTILNQQLKILSTVMPEIFNQIDGSTAPIKMLNSLQQIVNNPKYEKLNDNDKQVILLATLLNNTDIASGSTNESAFDAFFIAKKFNMSDKDAQKVYSIIETSDLIDRCMETKRKETTRHYRGNVIKGEEIEDKFDLYAFKLKEDNNFELAQMLYSTKYPKGFTRYFDKLMQNRINDIKSKDFILPQTPKETYQEKAENQTIKRGDNSYDVKVVKSSDIDNFYALIHTPEAGYATGGTRSANFANFEAFATLNDDKVICTSYIGNKNAGLVREYHNGFIFDVSNDKQYVAYGTDIFSLGKNIPDIIVEYYRDKGLMANRGRGDKYDHRTLVSNVLKTLLYGKNYYETSKSVDKEITKINNQYQISINNLNNHKKNKIKRIVGKTNLTNKEYIKIRNNPEILQLEQQIKKLKIEQENKINTIDGYSDLKEMDDKYIKRLDNIKSKLGDKTMSLENLREIDSEFAEAYETFLSRNGSEHTGEASLLRSGWHNEVLVSNPEISAIFTDDIEKLPEEYLKKSQEENIPIVIIDV